MNKVEVELRLRIKHREEYEYFKEDDSGLKFEFTKAFELNGHILENMNSFVGKLWEINGADFNWDDYYLIARGEDSEKNEYKYIVVYLRDIKSIEKVEKQ